jgi:hypothetical protein
MRITVGWLSGAKPLAIEPSAIKSLQRERASAIKSLSEKEPQRERASAIKSLSEKEPPAIKGLQR